MNNAVILRPREQSDVATYLDNFRTNLGLEPKGEYQSNFIFTKKDKDLEIIHILRIEFDNIFEELERSKQSQGTSLTT